MPKKGYKQKPSHKKKIAKSVTGKSNGMYKDGRRSYRRIAGAETSDGTVVHHKIGKRKGKKANLKSNLERLNDGKKKKGRRTTPKHEKITKRR